MVNRVPPQSYLDLVSKFALATIEDNRHLKEALAVINELLRKNLDKGGEMYLDVLSDLVEAYEAKAFPRPDVPQADVVKGLLDACSLSQDELSKKLGIAQSTISAIAGGRRKMTVEHIEKFARHFGVSPMAFLSSKPTDKPKGKANPKRRVKATN